jgi:hypothetical protein
MKTASFLFGVGCFVFSFFGSVPAFAQDANGCAPVFKGDLSSTTMLAGMARIQMIPPTASAASAIVPLQVCFYRFTKPTPNFAATCALLKGTLLPQAYEQTCQVTQTRSLPNSTLKISQISYLSSVDPYDPKLMFSQKAPVLRPGTSGNFIAYDPSNALQSDPNRYSLIGLGSLLLFDIDHLNYRFTVPHPYSGGTGSKMAPNPDGPSTDNPGPPVWAAPCMWYPPVGAFPGGWFMVDPFNHFLLIPCIEPHPGRDPNPGVIKDVDVSVINIGFPVDLSGSGKGCCRTMDLTGRIQLPDSPACATRSDATSCNICPAGLVGCCMWDSMCSPPPNPNVVLSTLPPVTSYIASTAARFDGQITSIGSASVVDHVGFSYSTSASGPFTTVTIPGSSTMLASGYTFNQVVSSLSCGTTYYFKAIGSFNGIPAAAPSLQSLTTDACPTPTPTPAPCDAGWGAAPLLSQWYYYSWTGLHASTPDLSLPYPWKKVCDYGVDSLTSPGAASAGSYAPRVNPAECSAALALYGASAPLSLTGLLSQCTACQGGGTGCYLPSVTTGNTNLVTINQATALSDLSNQAEIGSGNDYSCSRDVSGQVYCWGSNEEGRLGTGYVRSITTSSSTAWIPSTHAFRVKGVNNATALAVGHSTACAIVASGTGVKCWGSNDSGQLGAGSSLAYSEVPLAVNFASVLASGDLTASETFTKISVGGHKTLSGSTSTTACVVTSAGKLFCWGGNHHSQMGIGAPGSTLSYSVPVRAFKTSSTAWVGSIVQVSVGSSGTCVATSSSGIRKALCAGSYVSGVSGHGLIGNGSASSSSAADASDYAAYVQTSTGAHLTNVASISFSGIIGCANVVTSGTTGTPHCWGYFPANSSGYSNFAAPILLSGTTPVTLVNSIATGNFNAVFNRSSGAPLLIGINRYSQFGGVSSATDISSSIAINLDRCTHVDSSGAVVVSTPIQADCKFTKASAPAAPSGSVYTGSNFRFADSKGDSVHICTLLGTSTSTSGKVKCTGLNYAGTMGNGAYDLGYPDSWGKTHYTPVSTPATVQQ